MGIFVPVRDLETPRCERDAAAEEAERVHRRFHDPHSVDRGAAAGQSRNSRDDGPQEVRAGSRASRRRALAWARVRAQVCSAAPEHSRPPQPRRYVAQSTPGSRAGRRTPPRRTQRVHKAAARPFILSPVWRGAKVGYFFSRGAKGQGYYADAAQGDRWKRYSEGGGSDGCAPSMRAAAERCVPGPTAVAVSRSRAPPVAGCPVYAPRLTRARHGLCALSQAAVRGAAQSKRARACLRETS